MVDTDGLPSKRARTEEPEAEPTPLPSAPAPAAAEPQVVIYRLLLDGCAVYTGRTENPIRHLQEHASRYSGCRLVRSAFRRFGRHRFALQPIMWCSASDADANESYHIVAGNTMYPAGYNLRHGAVAGSDVDDVRDNTRLARWAFVDEADEEEAAQEAWADVGELIAGAEEGEDGESEDTLEKDSTTEEPAGQEGEDDENEDEDDNEEDKENGEPTCAGQTLGLSSRYHLEMYRLSLREEAGRGHFALFEVEAMLTAMYEAGARAGVYHYQMSHAFFRSEERGGRDCEEALLPAKEVASMLASMRASAEPRA